MGGAKGSMAFIILLVLLQHRAAEVENQKEFPGRGEGISACRGQKGRATQKRKSWGIRAADRPVPSILYALIRC